jgi:hypothetical protein
LKKDKEVYHSSSYLTAIEGSYSGFEIKDDCNINNNSRSDLGYDGRYELP